jgi:1,4-alpha-glucan branching enzyme
VTAHPRRPVGTFCLVLHTHLPWLAHHGSWPVGEEWLHQAWAMSYDRVAAVLEDFAADGRRDVLTLGVTPVVAAQLDDPYCLDLQRTWLADWFWRASGMTCDRDPDRRRLGRWEAQRAARSAEAFDRRWRNGGSAVLRRLADTGTVELLGGPLAHPFQPLLDPAVARFELSGGLDDARLRFGRRPQGIWAPECAYRPGLADLYAQQGVGHFLLDGPTLRHVGADTSRGHRIAGTDVVGFGRDLEVTYRVWSPRRGYPGGKWYRDFHTFDHEWGFRHSRVTSTSTPPHSKAPYDPGRAAAAVEADARDFVGHVRSRLADIERQDGSPGLVVAAYDTELFGHWWLEGPDWLRRVLTLLPEAGVRVTTLAGAREAGLVGGTVHPQSGSWGAGKDWHIWDGEAVHPLIADNSAAQIRVLQLLKTLPADAGRSGVADQLVRNLILALQSDWAFMVSHGSAGEYARSRHDQHHWSTAELADAIEHAGWESDSARSLAAVHRAADGPFGHLDARLLSGRQ